MINNPRALAGLFWLAALALSANAQQAGQSAADAQSLANERQQLPADFYEQHWQVDCDTAIRRAIAQQGSPQARLTELKKCAALYNLTGAPFSRPCPDFAAAAEQLSNAELAHEPRCHSR